MTATDIRHHVTTATDASDGEYDIDAIVAEIGDTYGYDTDPESIDTDAYWAIVGKHATETAYLISATTGDDLPGTELADVDGDAPASLLDMPEVERFTATQGYGVENPERIMYLLRESDEGTIPRGFDYIEIQVPARSA